MGMPGLETLIPIVYTHGVKAGRLTLEQTGREMLREPRAG